MDSFAPHKGIFFKSSAFFVVFLYVFVYSFLKKILRGKKSFFFFGIFYPSPRRYNGRGRLAARSPIPLQEGHIPLGLVPSQGALAFELLNLCNIPAFTVDPRLGTNGANGRQ